MDNKIKRIKELNAILRKACDDYYELSNPSMSDKTYDALYDELTALEKETEFILADSVTQKVQGKLLSGFEKIQHSKAVLSANKTKNIEDVEKFIGNNAFYASYKLDGLTLVIKYKKGILEKAITRGNGLIGEDVTEQARMIANLPLTIKTQENIEVRGECVIRWDDFKQINEILGPDYAYTHPRNLASGTLRQLDTTLVRKRKLRFVVFECVSPIKSDSKFQALQYIDSLGFETVRRTACPPKMTLELLTAEKSQYPVDGIVFELDSYKLSQQLGSTAHHNLCRLAYKWQDTTYETILRGVEWNTGKSGVITPVAVFDPVDLDGAITSRATLHNLKTVRDLELGIGDLITIYRANMVIPHVDDNITRSKNLKIPSVCPSCGHPTVVQETKNSDILVCENKNCPSKKLAQFVHFVSRNAANIVGLSEKTLELLLSHNLITCYTDLYLLKNKVNKLYELEGFGDTSVSNLLSAIEESRKIKLENYINALGINAVGLRTAKLIAQQVKGNCVEFYKAVEGDFDFSQIEGIGPHINTQIHAWAKSSNRLDIDLMQMFTFEDTQNSVEEDMESSKDLTGLRFCITGTFSTMSREEIIQQLETRGATFVSGVSKNLSVLFAGTNAGSKVTKATSLNVKISYEPELMEILSGVGDIKYDK